MPSASSFDFGSASSARSSVRDAIQSYRRVQYLVAGSTVAASSDLSVFEDDDEETGRRPRPFRFDEEDEESGSILGDSAPTRPREDSFIGQIQWDEDYDSVQPSPQRPQTSRSDTLTQAGYEIRPRVDTDATIPALPPIIRRPSEQTPLLKKTVSFSTLKHPQRYVEGSSPDKVLVPENLAPEASSYPSEAVPISRRRLSSGSAVSAIKHHHRGGQSTYGQTLFNSIAILLGIGMLSEPLAFAFSGWIVGTFLIISYAFTACYTAKILARVILTDPRVRSYSDIGRKAFGPKIMPFISTMFCLELFAVSVVLVTLYGDSLHSLMPAVSSNTFKAWGILILIPTVFLPLSLLSYTSILGIMSTVLMVVVIFIDGFSKRETPGSFWSPAPTQYGVNDYTELGVAFGLFMAGFSGHAVIPSLARDMVDPTQFDSMINWAFIVATCIYTAIGYAGYLMFGRDVSDEISVDLLRTSGYNPFLNQLCLWMLVLSPLSKFGLNTQPLNATLEVLLGIDTPISSPEDLVHKPDGLSVVVPGSRFGWKRVLGIIQRIFLTGLAVVVSIMVPEFSSVMAILGSFSAFLLSIVGPVLAKLMIEGRCTVFDGVIIATGVIMGGWGTLAAFS